MRSCTWVYGNFWPSTLHDYSPKLTRLALGYQVGSEGVLDCAEGKDDTAVAAKLPEAAAASIDWAARNGVA